MWARTNHLLSAPLFSPDLEQNFYMLLDILGRKDAYRNICICFCNCSAEYTVNTSGQLMEGGVSCMWDVPKTSFKICHLKIKVLIWRLSCFACVHMFWDLNEILQCVNSHAYPIFYLLRSSRWQSEVFALEMRQRNWKWKIFSGKKK